MKTEVVHMLASAEHCANTLDKQSIVVIVLCNVVCQVDTGNYTHYVREEDTYETESKHLPAIEFKETTFNESLGMHLYV